MFLAAVEVIQLCVMKSQTCQAGAKQMVEQNKATPGKGGAIITMSSVNGVTAIPSIAPYNASKGGIENLTRCCRASLDYL